MTPAPMENRPSSPIRSQPVAASNALPPAISRTLMRRGVTLFIALSVLGVMGTFLLNREVLPLREVIGDLHYGFLLACVVGVPVFDWLVAGLRMYLFARVVAPDVSYGACVGNCAVGGFMGAATPSQTGGGVAQAYVLVKEGATTGQALTILLLTFVSTLIFYVLVSVGLWGVALSGGLEGLEVSPAFTVAVAIFTLIAAGGLTVLARPRGVMRWLERRTGWFARGPRSARWVEKALGGLGDVATALELLGRRHKLRFAASVGLTIFVFGNKYFSAYLAARALGLDPPLIELMVGQVVLNVVIYFFPTPGGSGGAEVTAAAILANLIPAGFVPAVTVLWRVATMYLSVVVGGIILLRALNLPSGGATPEPATEAVP